MNKVVYIPSPHFPPSALPPAQRVRLLVKHLHEFRWKPVVFTVDHKYREEIADPWMVEISGTEFEKIEVNALDQNKTRKFKLGDLGIRMFSGLYRAMRKQIKIEKPALILYPVPPWYIMLMAPIIKRLTGIPYVIDFIDPWVYQLTTKNFKATVSQWIAKRLEGRVVRGSSAIFAVSQGILEDLKIRNPSIASIPLIAVPYGVEISDYATIQPKKKTDQTITLRYTGAVSEKMLIVVDSLFKALKKVNQKLPIRVIFTGTSYAGADFVKPVLENIISENDVADFITEYPSRVSYREALEINNSADMQLLIGDTTPYYAASKMMGLIASRKPFFAWVHKESFPAKFLEDLAFPYRLFFNTDELVDEQKIEELAESLFICIQSRDSFESVPIDNPIFVQYTAKAMTKTFVQTFEKIS